MLRKWKVVRVSVLAISSIIAGAAGAESKGQFILTPELERISPNGSSRPPPPTASETTSTVLPSAVRNTDQELGLPDLMVSEYSIEPKPPSQQSVVNVRIGVYNQSGAEAGPFTVQWWPGDNYQKPGCTWRVEGLAANGGRILKCSGYVYPSWYGKIKTGVYVDSDREVQESSERNNKLYRDTPVTKQQ